MEALQEPGLAERFRSARARTLDLVGTLKADDFTVQTAAYTSPAKWHLGHVSWIYEAIMSKINPDYTFYSDEYSAYLNSYYQQFGSPGDKDRRGVVSRPTTDEIMEYFGLISRRVEDLIGRGLPEEHGRLITMGVHHECQHQELLVYDLQHLLADSYGPARTQPPAAARPARDQVEVQGGLYRMGYGGDGFCYDIELPEHAVYLNDYRISALPVTNREYMAFIEAGGYGDYRYWLADGWEKARQNRWEAPMYWRRDGDAWVTADFAGRRDIGPDEPVCHVSYYEADAYCRWAGMRLPTEAEWEKAAVWNEKRQRKMQFPWGDGAPSDTTANLLESHVWRCAEAGSYPDGRSPAGCYQMIGDVWEWTSSEFVGYPGFRSGFDEYNDKWFTGQKVLRGGSFGTPRMSIRGSYRNFFRLDERWMFSGFRCAQDA